MNIAKSIRIFKNGFIPKHLDNGTNLMLKHSIIKLDCFKTQLYNLSANKNNYFVLSKNSNIFQRYLSITTQNENDSNNAMKKNFIELNGTNKLDSAFLARQFINTLTVEERQIIKNELMDVEKENEILESNKDKSNLNQKPTAGQIFSVCLQNGLPFIGFGFVDNFLMIIAGDIIESYIGIFLPISTMAAAGLGNAVSDVAGIGLAHHIEYFCSKLMNQPKLTAEQWNMPIVSWSIVISKSLCIFFGCVLGMSPLLFIDHEHKDKNKEEKSIKDD